MSEETPAVIDNPWQLLRRLTAARIALGRAGVSQPTAPHLAFQLAHAQARDAVHRELDTAALAQVFADGLPELQAALQLHSAADNRAIYMQRPDLGRMLDEASRAALVALAPAQGAAATAPAPGAAADADTIASAATGAAAASAWDLAVVVADGLSALAIDENALPFMQALMVKLAPLHLRIAPVAIVSQGRVALGDEVAELLGAQMVLVLIGERPGLSSPDSMGLYLTWQPKVGLTDAARNCISNVRPAGLTYDEAAHKLFYLLTEARRRALSGVALKDETEGVDAFAQPGQPPFLL
jgi:ethanolamine ammonia-lyase small subunit